MLWRKKQKKSETSKERDLFHEAFFPPKKNVRTSPSRRPFPWKFFGIALLWLFLSVTTVYTLFVSSFHSVENISVVGTIDIPEDRLEASLRDRMRGEYISIFPKNNFFLIRSENMGRFLLESFPKLRSVEIHKRFPNRIEVTVSERERIPMWCVPETCFLLDDDGTARDVRFAQQPENEPFLFRIEDAGVRAVVSGDRILDEKTLFRLLSLERGLNDSGIEIIPRVVTPSRVSEEFRFTTTEGWDILVNTGFDPETTMVTLRLVLEKEIPEEKRSKLRYIDLRTEKKVFYSFIPDEPAPTEESKDVTSDSEEKKSKGEKKK